MKLLVKRFGIEFMTLKAKVFTFITTIEQRNRVTTAKVLCRKFEPASVKCRKFIPNNKIVPKLSFFKR